jgi:hypothetical protein
MMEDQEKLLEVLLERAKDYGNTSYDLAKLKTLDKAADIVSSFVPHSFVLVLEATFLIFLSIGGALWIGGLIGEIFLGFFIVAAVYLVSGILIHFLFHDSIKRIFCDYFINQFLKK